MAQVFIWLPTTCLIFHLQYADINQFNTFISVYYTLQVPSVVAIGKNETTKLPYANVDNINLQLIVINKQIS